MFNLIIAQAAVPAAGGVNAKILNFLPFILIIAVFYFLMIRPQQKQQKQMKLMISEAKKGDEVMMAGGMYGTIVDATPTDVQVEVAKGVVIKFARTAIQSIKGYQLKK